MKHKNYKPIIERKNNTAAKGPEMNNSTETTGPEGSNIPYPLTSVRGHTIQTTSTMIIEPPIESLTEAIRAESLGASQLELCADLAHDGLTPSRELITEVINAVSIPVKVMIRPHYKNFMYSNKELDQMLQDITMAKELGASGIVLGILNKNNDINLKNTKLLSDHANSLNLQVTFHKAIDDTPDPVLATQHLAEMGGIHFILSSGGKATAKEGLETLKKMMDVAGNIQILAAGKITKNNLREIHAQLKTSAYHGRRILGEL